MEEEDSVWMAARVWKVDGSLWCFCQIPNVDISLSNVAECVSQREMIYFQPHSCCSYAVFVTQASKRFQREFNTSSSSTCCHRIGLVQTWANYGPRATYGPLGFLIRPAERVQIIVKTFFFFPFPCNAHVSPIDGALKTHWPLLEWRVFLFISL